MGEKKKIRNCFSFNKDKGGGGVKYAVAKIVTSPKAVWFACAFALALHFNTNTSMVSIMLIGKEAKETGLQVTFYQLKCYEYTCVNN
jgi:hypothetical protein